MSKPHQQDRIQDKSSRFVPQRKPDHTRSEPNPLIQFYPVYFVAIFFTVINLLIKCSANTVLTSEKYCCTPKTSNWIPTLQRYLSNPSCTSITLEKDQNAAGI